MCIITNELFPRNVKVSCVCTCPPNKYSVRTHYFISRPMCIDPIYSYINQTCATHNL